MEKILNIEDKIILPKKIHIQNIDDKYVILAYEKPNWIVLNYKEYLMYSLINDKKTILEVLIEYYKKYNETEIETTQNMQSLLEKIVRSDFFESKQSEENEEIEKIKKTIQIHLTHKCNMRCSHCYMSAGKAIDNELDEKQWKNALENITRYISNTEIVFTGGEPLIRHDSINIMKFAKEKGHKVVLFTNGVLINEENIGKISENIDEIQVSMEGVSENAYEKIRGKGNYNKFLKCIKLIKEYNIPLTLALTIIPYNIDDIEKNLVKFLNELNYNKITVRINSKLDKEGYAKDFPEEFFSNSLELENRVNIITKKLIEYGYSKENKYKRNTHFYNCGIGCSITIDSNGEIYPCSKLSISRGNIKSVDINNLINKFNYLNKNTEIKRMDLCKRCELKYICSGGCRIDNYNIKGSYLKPICNKNYKDNIYRSLIIEEL